MIRTKTAIVVLLVSLLVFFSVALVMLGVYLNDLNRTSPQNSIYVSQRLEVRQ